MSLPQSFDPTSPADLDSPSQGAAKIRDIVQKFIDVFGIPGSPTTITGSASKMDASGQWPLHVRLTNQTGGPLVNGNVVTIDTGNDTSVVLDDTQTSLKPFVVCRETSLASGSAGLFAVAGVIVNVTATGAIARGAYIRKSATTKAVEATGLSVSSTVPPPSGTVGVALTAAAANLVTAYWTGGAAGTTVPLPPTGGGTGLSSYTIGDLIVATAATTFASLADVADGNVLRSGGVGALPLYGKVRLSGAPQDVTGNLPVTNLNSGTGASNTTFWRGDGTWAAPNTGSLQAQLFVANGTWTRPSGVTLAWVTIQGAGGGGAGGSTNTAKGGGGGSAGETLMRYPYPTTSDVTVTVGTKGSGTAAAAGANNTSLGNNSSVAGGTLGTITALGALGSTVVGNGGTGGGIGGGVGGATGNPGAVGGAPTLVTVYDISGPGGGGSGNASTANGGAGGASLGAFPSTAAGGAGAANSATGGAGASSYFGAGGGSLAGAAGCAGKTGANATGNGAGGGGGCGSTTGGAAGGNGTDGLVIIEWIS